MSSIRFSHRNRVSLLLNCTRTKCFVTASISPEYRYQAFDNLIFEVNSLFFFLEISVIWARLVRSYTSSHMVKNKSNWGELTNDNFETVWMQYLMLLLTARPNSSVSRVNWSRILSSSLMADWFSWLSAWLLAPDAGCFLDRFRRIRLSSVRLMDVNTSPVTAWYLKKPKQGASYTR